jgi:mitosis inhibitor protein kinase SWE1
MLGVDRQDRVQGAMHLLSTDEELCHYTMHGLVGTGAFSEVYKVSSKTLHDTYYAVKRCKQRSLLGDLLAEVQVMTRLQTTAHTCANIMQFHSAWQEDGIFHMRLEYAEHGSVQELINRHVSARKEIPQEFLWKLVHDVSSGLAAIHAAGFVHLDIKPENILITNDKTLKIGDFGMATEGGVPRDGQEGDSR